MALLPSLWATGCSSISATRRLMRTMPSGRVDAAGRLDVKSVELQARVRIATGLVVVGDLFEYRDIGAVEVKGLPAPVPAWQVLRPSTLESRFEALRGSALTPLVGRNEELDLLLRRWACA